MCLRNPVQHPSSLTALVRQEKRVHAMAEAIAKKLRRNGVATKLLSASRLAKEASRCQESRR